MSRDYIFRITRPLHSVFVLFLADGPSVCDTDVDGVDPNCRGLSEHPALTGALLSSF